MRRGRAVSGVDTTSEEKRVRARTHRLGRARELGDPLMRTSKVSGLEKVPEAETFNNEE